MKLADIELPAGSYHRGKKMIRRGDGEVITHRASLTPGRRFEANSGQTAMDGTSTLERAVPRTLRMSHRS